MSTAHGSQTSSPDPLGLSQDNVPFSSPSKVSHKQTTPRTTLGSNDGNIRLQNFYFDTPPAPLASSSPSKSMTRSQNVVSPWKIRVTVEAEPENAQAVSPRVAMAGKTITTTVPIKDAAASSLIREKRPPGRPRKSLDGPAKRSGTPKPKTVTARKSNPPNKTCEQEGGPAGATTTTPKRPRGRPRKSLEPGSQRSTTEARPRSGKKQAVLSSAICDTKDKDLVQSCPEEPSARNETTNISDMDGENNITCGVSYPEVSLDQAEYERADEARWRSRLRHDSLSPSKPQKRLLATDAMDSSPKTANTDPTDAHQEFDSIMESEGFSMVSVSSLPSVQQHSGEAVTSKQQDIAGQPRNPSLASAKCAGPFHGSSAKDITPFVASSLALPPPIVSAETRTSPRPLAKPTDGTPRLARIVRAGIALQGALSPTYGGSNASTSVSKSKAAAQTASAAPSEQGLDSLFGGFGPGTRRELRAGLRFGEELAKRQRVAQPNTSLRARQDDDVFTGDSMTSSSKPLNLSISEAYTLKIPEPERKVEYPSLTNNQLPSPEGSTTDDNDRMSWKATSPQPQEPILPSAERNAERDWEAEWQREREAVSKQIQDANSSQVIVIDSDSEDDLQEEVEYEDDVDIWLAEANRADIAILEPELPKPKRSKIPSPWRRQSQIVYTDELEPTDSDSITQPKEEVSKVIAKGEHAVQQRNDELASSPVAPFSNEISFSSHNLKADTSTQETHQPMTPPEHANRLLAPRTDAKSLEETVTKVSEQIVSSTKLSEVKDIDQSAEYVSYPDINRDFQSRQRMDRNVFISDQGDTRETSKVESASDRDIRSTRSSPSRTPPGFPPKRLYKTLYKPPPRPAPTQPSWLGNLASYVPSIWATGSNFPSLYTHLPVTEAHYYIFLPYYLAQHANPTKYPFNPYSPNTKLLNVNMISIGNEGWIKYFSKSDIGLIDKMQEVLRVKGVRRRGLWGTADGKPIDENELAKIIHTLWRDGVQKGHWEPGEGNGTGNLPFSKKKWTKADIKPEPYPAIGFIMP